MGKCSKTFPGRPDQVAEARRFVRDALGDDPVTEVAELVVSELSTNALNHSLSGSVDGWFVVSVWFEPGQPGKPGAAQVSVTDLGADALPEVADPSRDAECGRGLRLVDCTAKEWGFEPTGLGLRVWADLVGDDQFSGV